MAYTLAAMDFGLFDVVVIKSSRASITPEARRGAPNTQAAMRIAAISKEAGQATSENDGVDNLYPGFLSITVHHDAGNITDGSALEDHGQHCPNTIPTANVGRIGFFMMISTITTTGGRSSSGLRWKIEERPSTMVS